MPWTVTAYLRTFRRCIMQQTTLQLLTLLQRQATPCAVRKIVSWRMCRACGAAISDMRLSDASIRRPVQGTPADQQQNRGIDSIGSSSGRGEMCDNNTAPNYEWLMTICLAPRNRQEWKLPCLGCEALGRQVCVSRMHNSIMCSSMSGIDNSCFLHQS